MGRGDIKTKKGKTFSGSFGKTRPAKVVKKAADLKRGDEVETRFENGTVKSIIE